MDDMIIGTIIGVIIGVIISFSIIDSINARPGKAIIEHGCAEYNKTTGDFQWLDKR